MVLVFFFALFIFLIPAAVYAQTDGAVKAVLGWLIDWSSATIFTIVSTLLYWPIHFFGKLSSLLIAVLVFVANYNDFIDQQGVSIGWTVVRDLANMFVVMGILIIAMGTLLNVENYSYKKLLPKLILAAVVINFSKMLVGVMIDVSQVITLTFVHGFQDIAAGNLVNAIGLDKILSLSMSDVRTVSAATGGDNAALSVLSSLLLAIIVLVVTAAVLLVLIAYFVGRIIILWMAIILSPLLFVLPFIPKGEKFASQVWEMISKQLMAGPLLAFFLWLSFLIMDVLKNPTDPILSTTKTVAPLEFQAFVTQISTVNGMLNFVVVVGLLFSSLMLASQMGAAGGKMAGNLAGKMQGAGKWLAQRPQKWAEAGGLAFGRKADKWSIGLQERVGIKKPVSLRPSIIKSAWEEARKRREEGFYKAKGVYGGMEDIFNRVVSFNRDKSNQQKIERDSHVTSRAKEISTGGESSEILLGRLYQLLKKDKDGHYRMRKGNEADVEAIFHLLAKNHDPNEYFKDKELGAEYNNFYRNRTVKKMLKNLFGKEAPRIAYDLGAIGLDEKDAHLFAMALQDPKSREFNFADVDENTGKGKSDVSKHMRQRLIYNVKRAQEREGKEEEYKKDFGSDEELIKIAKVADAEFREFAKTYGELTEDNIQNKGMNVLTGEAREVMAEELQSKIAAIFQAKKDGTNLTNKLTKQDFFDESSEGLGDRLTISGKQFLLTVAHQMATDQRTYNASKEETRAGLASNARALKMFADSKLEVNEDQKKDIYTVIDKLLGGKGEDRITSDQLDERIKRHEELGGKDKGKSKDREEEARVDHREQVTRKKQKINETESGYTKLEKEVEGDETIRQTMAREGKINTPEYKSRVESMGKKKETVEAQKRERDVLHQQIYTEHYPAMAGEAIAGLDAGAFVDPTTVNKLSEKIGEAITTAMADVDKSDFDFEKVAKDMEGHFKGLGETIKKSIKDTSKAPDLGFVTAANMSPLNETATQSKMLSKLKEIAESLKAKTAGGK